MTLAGVISARTTLVETPEKETTMSTTGGGIPPHEPVRDPAQEALAAIDRARQALNDAELIIKGMSLPPAAPAPEPQP